MNKFVGNGAQNQHGRKISGNNSPGLQHSGNIELINNNNINNNNDNLESLEVLNIVANELAAEDAITKDGNTKGGISKDTNNVNLGEIVENESDDAENNDHNAIYGTGKTPKDGKQWDANENHETEGV